MGALDTLNGSGAGIATINGVLPENSIPTSIARDTEVPTVASWAQNSNTQIADSAIPSDIARDSEIPTNNNQLTNGAGYVTTDTTYTASGGLSLSASNEFFIAVDGVNGSRIADDAVSHSELQVSNAGSDGQVLTRRTSATGGMTWETAGGGVSIPSNNGIGTTALMRNESNAATWNNGQSRSGTGIRLTGLDQNGTSLYGTTVSGTWRNTGASLQGSRQTTTGLRIS